MAFRSSSFKEMTHKFNISFIFPLDLKNSLDQNTFKISPHSIQSGLLRSRYLLAPSPTNKLKALAHKLENQSHGDDYEREQKARRVLCDIAEIASYANESRRALASFDWKLESKIATDKESKQAIRRTLTFSTSSSSSSVPNRVKPWFSLFLFLC